MFKKILGGILVSIAPVVWLSVMIADIGIINSLIVIGILITMASLLFIGIKLLFDEE